MKALRSIRDAKHSTKVMVEFGATIALMVAVVVEQLRRNAFSGTGAANLDGALLYMALLFALGMHSARALGWMKAHAAHEKMQAAMGRLPESIAEMGIDSDGNRMLGVTRADGEMVTATVPPDYHPSDDNFELVLRQVCPETYDDDEINVQYMGEVRPNEDEL